MKNTEPMRLEIISYFNYKKLNVLQPRDGYFELDPNELVDQIKKCIKNCIKNSSKSNFFLKVY